MFAKMITIIGIVPIVLILYFFPIASSIFIPLLVFLWYRKRGKRDDTPMLDDGVRSELFVAVVGAGFSGICTAVKLKQQKIPFVVFEKASNIGGTWWHTRYPGCGCDIPSQLYSFSFHPKKDWSQSLPLQKEILAYLEETCRYFSITENFILNTKVVECSFNNKTKKWKLKVGNGDVYECTHLVSGIGALHEPKWPDIVDQDRFKGDKIHTALWPSDFDLTGKKVGIIGTGCSTAQLLPSIVEKVDKVFVFQRSAGWISPELEIWFPEILKKVPIILKFYRLLNFMLGEMYFLLFLTSKSATGVLLTKSLKSWMKNEVSDEGTAEKLIPSIEPGCKRIIVRSNYLSSFNKPNVTLVDTPIDRVTETGLQTKDGENYEFDTLIYATGYDSLASMKNLNVLRPRDNRPLSEIWGSLPNAYYGIMYPDFPNFFILVGPNGVLAHNSVVFMIECQVEFTIKAIVTTMKQKCTTIQVTEKANSDFQRNLQQTMKKRVFNANDCNGWYCYQGNNFTLWPNYCISYWWNTSSFDMKHFRFE